MKNKLSILAIIIIGFAYVFYVSNNSLYKKPEKIIVWDVISYYSYLPATFIEKDHKLQQWEYADPWKDRYWPEYIPATKSFVIKTSMGLAFMYYPFFQTAHFIAPYLGYENNGFSAPYSTALILSSIVYVLIGLFLLRKILLHSFNDNITSITLLIIGLFTNLFWYTTKEAPMPHSYSFALFCLFMFLTDKWYQKPNYINSIACGLTLGLIALVRPTNIVIVLYFLLYGVIRGKDLTNRFHLYLSKYKQLIIMSLCICLVWIPQLLYWKSVTNHFFYYSYGSSEQFFFANPKIINVLVGFRKGWLTYTPAMIFSIIGIFLLKNKKYFWSILSFTVINIYIVSSWWCWWYGGGLGMRPLIESYALLSIPLAAYLTWICNLQKKYKVSLIIITTFIVIQSGFHTMQYHYKTIHYEAMTAKAYFDSFWRINKTENFETYLSYPNYLDAKQNKR